MICNNSRNGGLQPFVSMTVRWDREYKQQEPDNHDFRVLVTDCVEQLKLGQIAFCFTEEQKSEIAKRVPFELLVENQDGILAMRRK